MKYIGMVMAVVAVMGCEYATKSELQIDVDNEGASKNALYQSAADHLAAEVEARKTADAQAMAAMTMALGTETGRAEAAEAAEAARAIAAEAGMLAAAKAYADGRAHPIETHLKNLTSGQLLGRQLGTYVTREMIGGVAVDLDWVFVVTRDWDQLDCEAGGGKVFVATTTHKNAALPAPPSLLSSARYISPSNRALRLDDEAGIFISRSYEDATGKCLSDTPNTYTGYTVTETVAKGGTTDDGAPIKLARPRELTTADALAM